MQVEEQHQKKLSAITHSPYYGCTVRVVSKANVSYEGVLDGISTNKDRVFLKNVRVNANITPTANRNHSIDDLGKNLSSDTLNAVMIDHLTNDIHTYEEVCLNVRDIQELRLIHSPSTFNESKAKLRAIDPCLIDIRLSSSDDYETRSNGATTDHRARTPVPRQIRGESFGSTGGDVLISSSSNESSSSFGHRSGENYADESNDESIDEQIEKFSQLTTSDSISKPITLLAKKVLPKKIERRTDVPLPSTFNTNNNNNNNNNTHQIIDDLTRGNDNNTQTLKKGPVIPSNRKLSPVRVTITSNLNPHAIPFYAQRRNLSAMQNTSFTFYERPRFRPRLATVVSPDRGQSVPYGRNAVNNPYYQHQQQQQQQRQNSYQRFVPLRQMAIKKNIPQVNPTRTNTRPVRPPPPVAKYRFHSTTSLDKVFYPQPQRQQQQKHNSNNNIPSLGLMRQTSLPTDNHLILPQQIQGDLFRQRNNPIHQSTTSLHSTASLPYQYGSSVERNQGHTPVSFGEPIGSHRNSRTISMASSCSNVSVDIGPHSIVQFDSPSSNALPSFGEQYDFEKANEEFRRYLELEELVTRRSSSHCSTGSSSDINVTQQQQQQPQSQSNSYKKDVSFFDHISCTATTGTAVGYTEMDETEKNLETFGDDALFLTSNTNDNEWQF